MPEFVISTPFMIVGKNAHTEVSGKNSLFETLKNKKTSKEVFAKIIGIFDVFRLVWISKKKVVRDKTEIFVSSSWNTPKMLGP